MELKIRKKKRDKTIWGAAGLLAAAFLLTGCGAAGRESDLEQTVSEEIPIERDIEGEVENANAESSVVSEEPGGRESEGTDFGQEGGESRENETGQDAGAIGEDVFGEQDDGASPEITLVMVGDILLHTPVAESGRLEEGGYDFSGIFSEMREEISAADLALVNQEVIIGGEELGISGYPAFNAPYELGDALTEAGFDVVLHATNHALDKGKRGILNCLSYWREKHPDMAVLGVHESLEEQQEIYVYEQQGVRIAILNYTYGTNGIPLPEDMPYAVDMLEEARVVSDLARAEELADFVVVCPHWGTEYTLAATETQKRWAQLFMENGADLVIGTHPHVIEPVEWIGREESGDADESGEGALVYYSLGNFVNWTAGTGEGVANRMVGAMAKVTIGRNDAGEAVILSYETEPLVCHVEQGFGGVKVYPLEKYTEELAERNEIAAQDGNFSLEYCKDLVLEVFGTDVR